MSRSRWRYATLISVLVVCAALVTLTLRLRSSEHESEHLRAAVVAQEFAIRTNREAVTELCRTNAILRGLISEAIDQRKDLVKNVPPAVAARYRISISVYEGYLERLDQQTACREVVRP